MWLWSVLGKWFILFQWCFVLLGTYYQNTNTSKGKMHEQVIRHECLHFNAFGSESSVASWLLPGHCSFSQRPESSLGGTPSFSFWPPARLCMLPDAKISPSVPQICPCTNLLRTPHLTSGTSQGPCDSWALLPPLPLQCQPCVSCISHSWSLLGAFSLPRVFSPHLLRAFPMRSSLSASFKIECLLVLPYPHPPLFSPVPLSPSSILYFLLTRLFIVSFPL